MSEERNDNINKDSIKNKPTLCRFISTRDGCKNGTSCTFSHNVSEVENWRLKAELSPKQLIKDEVDKAVQSNNLNELFNKMLSTEENYNKYFSAVESKFYNISTWKLQKKSIKKQIFENIEKGEVELDEVILPYGYMPICLYFLFKGLAAKMYNEGTSNDENIKIEECVDEIMQCITDYYKKECADVLKMVTEYQNPKYNYNIIETATFYFSTKIIKEFKMSLSTDDFKLLITDNVKKIFDDRSKDIDNIKKKYEQNFNKSSDSDSAEKLKFCINDIEIKIKEFNFNFFVVASRPRTFKIELKPIDKFNKILLNSDNEPGRYILKDLTIFGTPYNQVVVGQLLSLIKLYFMDSIEDKINLILSKLPKDILNANQLIIDFKSTDNISYLWSYIKNSITLENILSICPPILYEFFKEEKLGIRESYTGEYMTIFYTIHSTSSKPIQKELIEILSKADYKFDLKHYK
jgi:hypothetical protein